jgi:hypothetical protein
VLLQHRVHAVLDKWRLWGRRGRCSSVPSTRLASLRLERSAMSTDGTVCRTDARWNAFAGPLPACGLLGRVSAWLLPRGGSHHVLKRFLLAAVRATNAKAPGWSATRRDGAWSTRPPYRTHTASVYKSSSHQQTLMRVFVDLGELNFRPNHPPSGSYIGLWWRVRDVSRLGACHGHGSAVRADHSENNECPWVRSLCQFGPQKFETYPDWGAKSSVPKLALSD